MATSTENLWDSYDGKGFAAEHSQYSDRASMDEAGLDIHAETGKLNARADRLPAEAPGEGTSTASFLGGRYAWGSWGEGEFEIPSAGPQGFLYLTYFNRYPDESVSHNTSYDIPEIGNTVLYLPVENPFYRTTLSDWNNTPRGNPSYTGITGYIGVPGMSGWLSKYINDSALLEHVNGNETVSIEGIFNVSEAGYWSGYGEWGSFGMSPANGYGYYSTGYNYYYSDRGTFIGVPGNCDIEDLSSDFTVGWFDGDKCAFIMPKEAAWRRSTGIHHFAYVFDRSVNKIRCYYDGAYAATANSIPSVLDMGFSNSSSYTGLQFTQFAIRSGDCSINNGAAYPLPREPYIQF